MPSAPLKLTIEDVSDSSVTVSWEPPESLGTQGLQGYVLELRKEGGELWAEHAGTRERAWETLAQTPLGAGPGKEARGSGYPQEALVPQLQGAPE